MGAMVSIDPCLSMLGTRIHYYQECLVNCIEISHILIDNFGKKSTKGSEVVIFGIWGLEKL